MRCSQSDISLWLGHYCGLPLLWVDMMYSTRDVYQTVRQQADETEGRLKPQLLANHGYQVATGGDEKSAYQNQESGGDLFDVTIDETMYRLVIKTTPLAPNLANTILK